MSDTKLNNNYDISLVRILALLTLCTLVPGIVYIPSYFLGWIYKRRLYIWGHVRV